MVKKITKIKIIQRYLFDYGKSYYLREIASLLKKPHQSIKPYIEQLVQENILIKNKRKKIIDYTLNFKENKVYDYLTIAEKEKLLERLKEDMLLKVLFEKLSLYFDKATFVIFGSFAKQTKAEDIDLLVTGKCNLKETIEDFQNIYNKKIHLIQVSSTEKITISLLQEVYKKHLILNNTEKIVRWFGDLYAKNRLV